MAEANRSLEEIVEAGGGSRTSQAGSGHRPVGPFGPVPRNSQMEQTGQFQRTPVVAGDMPRHQSDTSALSAAYHTVQGSASDESASAGYQTTHGGSGGEPPQPDSGDDQILLPSRLSNGFKSQTYWSRTGLDSSSARASSSAERARRPLPTSGSSSLSEPRPRGQQHWRAFETAEAMTYEERRSEGRRSSDASLYRNAGGTSSAASSGARSPAGGGRFPFQATESGNVRVPQTMVAYQDRNLAILVADPVHTRLQVKAKEKRAKSTGSAADRLSAEIHASYDNLSATERRGQIREVASPGSSAGGGRHQFYDTSENDSRRQTPQRDWASAEAAYASRHWEDSERRQAASDSGRRAAGGGGSRRSGSRGGSERAQWTQGGGARPGSRGSRSGRTASGGGGGGFAYDPCAAGGGGGGGGGSGRASSPGSSSSTALSGGRRRSLSPRPAASARLEPTGQDAPTVLQRLMQPADDDDGFRTVFVSREAAGSRRAASATTLYAAPGVAAGGAPAVRPTAAAAGGGGGGMDEAGYPRRSSGDWRRRCSAVSTMVQDEVCDLEEREEVYSGSAKEQLSRQRDDAGSLERIARRADAVRYTDEQPVGGAYGGYSGASGGRQQQKRELGVLAEEAARSASEADCYIHVGGSEVPCVSWAVRRYSRYLQQLGSRSPRHITLPEGSVKASAVSDAVQWCYLPADLAKSLINADNCADLYQAAQVLDIPDLIEQCQSYLDREQPDMSRGQRTTINDETPFDNDWRSFNQVEVTVDDDVDDDDSDSDDQEEIPDTQRFTDRTQRRRSSYGSSSPRRSYSRLYTEEEQEAATKIQAGYRGFRARQELKRKGLVPGSARSRRLASSSRRTSSAASSGYSSRVDTRHRSQDEIRPRPLTNVSPRSQARVRPGSQVSFKPRSEAAVKQVRPKAQAETRPRSHSDATQRFRVDVNEKSAADMRNSSSPKARTLEVKPVSSTRLSQASVRGRFSQAPSVHKSQGQVRSRSLSKSRSAGSRSPVRPQMAFRERREPTSPEEHAAVVIQRNFRCYNDRVHYGEKRYAAATIQRFIRGYLARKHVQEMQEAATKIQTCFRDHLDARRAAVDPEDRRPSSRRISSSSDWKCRNLLHPEGSTVLVMAGLNPMQDYCAKYNSGRDMYRYEPLQNAWEYVGRSPEPRHHASVAHVRGLVYLVGGTDPRHRDAAGRCRPLDTVWILDPSTGDWWPGPAMQHARIHHGTAVAQGQLYVIGGQDAAGCALTSVELFDPDKNSWQEIGPLGCGRLGAATAVYHHRIWVVGGMCPAKRRDVVCTVDVYDTIRRRWCSGPPLRHPRCFARLVVSAQRLFVVGGAGRTTRHQKAISSVDTLDRFEEEQRAWVHVAQMKSTRHGHAVVPFNEQEFLILGGVSSQAVAALDLVEQYNARSNNWVRGVARLPAPVSGLAAVTVPRPRARP